MSQVFDCRSCNKCSLFSKNNHILYMLSTKCAKFIVLCHVSVIFHAKLLAAVTDYLIPWYRVFLKNWNLQPFFCTHCWGLNEIQDFRGKSSLQKEGDSFHQQIGRKFKEETSTMLHLSIALYSVENGTLWKVDKNTWKGLKYGGGKICRRSFGLIVWKMKKY